MEQSFFEQVLDALAGSVATEFGRPASFVHRRGLKVWFGEPGREHYETQLMQMGGDVVLEIGFHAEHPKVAVNEAVLARFAASEKSWRKALGPEPVAGEFIGRSGWRRVSEAWPVPPDDIDAAIEVAARLADYIVALEPLRRAGAST